MYQAILPFFLSVSLFAFLWFACVCLGLHVCVLVCLFVSWFACLFLGWSEVADDQEVNNLLAFSNLLVAFDSY